MNIILNLITNIELCNISFKFYVEQKITQKVIFGERKINKTCLNLKECILDITYSNFLPNSDKSYSN